jgi:hypothetical protein
MQDIALWRIYRQLKGERTMAAIKNRRHRLNQKRGG